MNKQAVIPALFGGYKRMLGSYAGPAAPPIFQNIGNPLLGTVLQSGVGALAGYGAGKAVNWLTDKDTNLPTALALGGLASGPALNWMRLKSRFNHDENKDPGHDEAYDMYKADKLYGDGNHKLCAASFAKQALMGMGGPDVSAVQLKHMIDDDPNMSTLERAKLFQLLSQVEQREGAHINVTTLMDAAADAGVGYLMGTIVSRATNWLFGGISPGAQTGIKMTGMIGGLLRNAGIL